MHRHSLRRFPLFVASLAGLACAFAARADHNEPVVAGHSVHGEAFNEGPRQKAYLMDGTGKVNFPITTTAPLAQKFFNQGIGQLHGFWYFEAERSFRQAAALDTNCATAYLGMTLANANNGKRAREFIKKATALKAKVSAREAAWIDAWAALYKNDKVETSHKRDLVKSLEKIVAAYPDDLEAKAFLAGTLWDAGIRNDADRKVVEKIVADIMKVEPMHPAHHYRIHLWNTDTKDTNALVSAALCGQASPSIAHMWHMPGHTFSALKRYADAAWQQEAAARTDHANMMHDRVLPDQIHNYAHNNEWLIRDLNHLGRVHDSVDLAKNMIELPRHPKYNTLTKGSASYGRARLVETLQRYELWDEVVALADTVYLEPTDLPAEQIKRLRVLGVAYFQKDNPVKGGQQIAGLEAILKKEPKPAAPAKTPAKACDGQKEYPEKTERKSGGSSTNAPATTSNQTALENALAELRALQALKAGELDAAKKQFASVKDFSKERQAQFHFALGDKDKAVQLAREAANSGTNQVQLLANYVDLLYRSGKYKEAFDAFFRLKEKAVYADLDAPVFTRLAPVAADLKLGRDWRDAPAKPSDVGVRPPLARLGPFRWHPSTAADWALPGADGKTISLKQYRGKPVVVIFYLGAGCLHCIEQMNAFAPMKQEFADAGISLVAVSTDTVPGLKETLAKAKLPDGYGFPLVSDPSLKTFKAYRAFDDFEQQPLHGTFLVDADGLVRWQDISFQPFTETKFLLGEAKRLLKQPKDRPEGKPMKLADKGGK